jgi:hypothetical protein
MPLYRHTKLPPPPELGEKTFWQYLPRQAARRVLFLLIALGAVLILKRSGRWSLGGLLDTPPKMTPGADPGAPVYHIRVAPQSSPPARGADEGSVPKSKSAP